MLLPAAVRVPDVSAMQWNLHALLLQVDALPDLLPMQRLLHALLLQTDALSLQSACSAVRLLHARLLRLGPLSWSPGFSRSLSSPSLSA